MNVLRAIQVFHPTVTSSLRFLKDSGDSNFSGVSSIVNFMEMMYSSKSCSNAKSCPKCGESEGLDHTPGNCRADELKCVNCLRAVREDKELLDVRHGAWDLSCPIYLRHLEKFKKGLLLKK
ncbi:hypothetical protein Zmor_014610 [Zophobas morio]|uniref:Uncharacterized protein n=1 Tax=Zophobas morio TaxID=2755281 RepID=A0AA38IGG5_9CUCU|nr:hypothetical protein Zmor_014610 [Zophobas morio]